MSSSSTDLAFANPALAAQDSYDSELMKLSENVKPFTWVIKVSCDKNGEKSGSLSTGFAINIDKYDFKNRIEENDLVLMSCAHSIEKNLIVSIKVRRVGDKNFDLEAKILSIKFNWDMTLLVVKDVKPPRVSAEFVDEGSISNCQTLLHMGHSEGLAWSAFVGRAAYPCVNTFQPFSNNETCGTYVSTILKTTPCYRIMGHVINQAYLREASELDSKFLKDLHPLIPIIQCANFVCEGGCSGGPVFNTQGKVVGMLVMGLDDCSISIHVTLLKEFVKLAAQDSNKVYKRGKQHVGTGHGSQDAREVKGRTNRKSSS